MIIELEAFKTSEKMPETFVPVILNGCAGFWDGEEWRTNSHRDVRPIQWDVKWWMPFPVADEID